MDDLNVDYDRVFFRVHLEGELLAWHDQVYLSTFLKNLDNVHDSFFCVRPNFHCRRATIELPSALFNSIPGRRILGHEQLILLLRR